MGGAAQAAGGSAPESSASLDTGAKPSPGDRVLGEIEKDSFMLCQAKGDTPGFCSPTAPKNCVSSPENLMWVLITWVKGGVSDKIRV